MSRRDFCQAGVSAIALLGSASNGLLLAQDTKPAPQDTTKKDGAGKDNEKKKDEPAPRKLITSVFPKGWVFFAAEDGNELKDTWSIGKDEKSGTEFLRCLGKPYGYLRTEEIFENYELRLKWRFPTAEAGNSGILLHTSGKDHIWPTSIQVQLHQPTAGSVYPTPDAKSDNKLEVKDHARKINEWNECVVTCIDGKISLEINKRKVGEVTGCQPNKGRIGLQSEGSEIHFQEMILKDLSKKKQA